MNTMTRAKTKAKETANAKHVHVTLLVCVRFFILGLRLVRFYFLKQPRM